MEKNIEELKNLRLELFQAISDQAVNKLRSILSNIIYLEFNNIEGETPLTMACAKGDPGIVSLLLEHHAEPGWFNKAGKNSLHVTVEHQHTELVPILIEYGVNIFSADHESYNAFHLACKASAVGCIDLFIEKDKRIINSINRINGISAAHILASQNKLDLLKKLFYDGLDLNIKNRRGQTPLAIAEKMNYEDVVAFISSHLEHKKNEKDSVTELKKSNQNSDSVKKEKKLAFEHYQKAGEQNHPMASDKLLQSDSQELGIKKDRDKALSHEKIVKDLNLEKQESLIQLEIKTEKQSENDGDSGEADLSDQGKPIVEHSNEFNVNGDDFERMGRACEEGNLSLVKALELTVKDLNFQFHDKDGVSFLMIAAKHGMLNVVEYLLNNGANINLINRLGRNAFMYACYGNALVVVQFLLQKKAGLLKSSDKQGNSALLEACRGGAYETAVFLFKKGLNIASKNKCGVTPLMNASQVGNLDLAGFLVDLSNNLNVTDNEGNSALHYAVKFNRHSVVSLLMAKKIFLNNANKKSMTPLMIAVLNNADDIIQTLVDAGASYNQVTGSGPTPLMMAIEQHRFSSIKKLIGLGADLSLVRSKKESAFSMLCRKGSNEVIDHIFNLDKSIVDQLLKNRYDNKKKTCFQIAAESCQEETLYRLLKKSLYSFNFSGYQFDDVRNKLDEQGKFRQAFQDHQVVAIAPAALLQAKEFSSSDIEAIVSSYGRLLVEGYDYSEKRFKALMFYFASLNGEIRLIQFEKLIKGLSSFLRKHFNEFDEKRLQLHEASQKLDKARDAVKMQKQVIHRITNERDSLISQLEKAKDDLAEANLELPKSKEQIERSREKRKTEQNSVEYYRFEVEQNREKYFDLKERLLEFEQQKRHWESKIDEVEREIRDIEYQISVAGDRGEYSIYRLGDLQSQLIRFQSEKDDHSNFSAFSGSHNECDYAKSEYEESLSSLRFYEDEVLSLDREIDMCWNKIREYENVIATYPAKIKNYQSEIESKKNILRDENEKLEILCSDLNDCEKKHVLNKKRYNDFVNFIAQYVDFIIRLELLFLEYGVNPYLVADRQNSEEFLSNWSKHVNYSRESRIFDCLKRFSQNMEYLMFCVAIYQGNFGRYRLLKSINKDVINQRDEKNRAPIHYACMAENFQALQFLLEKGAQIEALDCEKNSVLHYAYRNEKLFNYLLSRSKPMMHQFNNDGYSAFEYSIKGHYWSSAMQLISHKDFIGIPLSRFSQLLMDCLKAKQYQLVKMILLKNDRKKIKLSAELAQLILDEKNIDIDKTQLIKLLIYNGLDVNVIIEGKPLIFIAVLENNIELLQYLLLNSVNTNITVSLECKQWRGFTPLYKAVADGNYSAVKLLLSSPDISLYTRVQTGNVITSFFSKAMTPKELAEKQHAKEIITLFKKISMSKKIKIKS